MSKPIIAVITGGNVAERGISLKSAATVYHHLDENKYRKFLIELNGTEFSEQSSKTVLDKNDFSLTLNNEKIHFDLILFMLHGHPAEDGCLQGYFEVLGIPYTGCDHFVSALTFNKQACKNYLMNYGVPMAPSHLLRKGQTVDWEALRQMELPVFVKPNCNGSSYGVTKVNQAADMEKAVAFAFEYDEEVIVEGFLDGVEYSNGVVRHNGEVVVLPVTEIVPQNDFFDYKAKYENQSQEITPARLSPEKTAECQAHSKHLYEVLGCSGMSRFDYILVGETFYFLEANTIPGMTEQSIIPQEALAHGWSLQEFLDILVEEQLRSIKQS